MVHMQLPSVCKKLPAPTVCHTQLLSLDMRRWNVYVNSVLTTSLAQYQQTMDVIGCSSTVSKQSCYVCVYEIHSYCTSSCIYTQASCCRMECCRELRITQRCIHVYGCIYKYRFSTRNGTRITSNTSHRYIGMCTCTVNSFI